MPNVREGIFSFVIPYQKLDLRTQGVNPHFPPTFCCGIISIRPDCVALGRPARRTARVRLRELRILSEDWKEPRSERRGSRCKAARRRRCRCTSSRSANTADAPAPPESAGRMGIAGDLFVARRQRCASASPRNTHARDLLYFHYGLLEHYYHSPAGAATGVIEASDGYAVKCYCFLVRHNRIYSTQ